MNFARDIFQPDGLSEDPVRLRGQLRPGRWLVEAGSHPPQAHRPGLLLADVSGQAGMAISLRSATLLQLNLVAALLHRLQAEGCTLEQLATLALHEMLLNAVIHGNLRVASQASGAWIELAARQGLIAAALRDPVRAARLVTVALGWDATSVYAVVADQGSGYHTNSAVIAGERCTTGRGLAIARAAAHVEVQHGGRCTKLTFDRSRATIPA